MADAGNRRSVEAEVVANKFVSIVLKSKAGAEGAARDLGEATIRRAGAAEEIATELRRRLLSF